MKLNVLIMGRSYHTTRDVPEAVELPDDASLEDVVQQVNQSLPPEQPLTDSCLVILDGKHLGSLADHDPVTLGDGGELMFIAPVAGG